MRPFGFQFFILFLLFSVAASAQVETLSDRIEQINSRIESHPNENFCLNCTLQNSDLRNYDLCIQQICPTGNGSYRIAEDRYGALALTSTPDVNRFDDELNPLLIESGLKQGELYRQVLNRMQSLASQNHQFTDPNIVRLLNYYSFVNQHLDILNYVEKADDGSLNFNQDLYRSHNLEISREDWPAFVSRANAYIEFRSEIEQNFLHIGEFSFLNSSESVSTRTQTMLQEMRADTRWIRSNTNHPIYQSLTNRFSQNYRRLRKSSSISPDEIKDLQFEYLKIKELRRLLEKPSMQSAFSGVSVSVNELVQERNFRHGILGVVQNTPTPEYIEESIHFGWNLCRKALAMGEDLLPSEADLPEVRLHIQQAKTLFLSQLQNVVSESSYPRLIQELENVQIGLPLSKESHRKSVFNAIRKNIAQIQKDLRRLSSEDISNDQLAIEFAQTSYPDPRDQGSYNGDNICRPYVISSSADMAMHTESDFGFQVSPVTVANIANNKSVFAHEFSHILDTKMQSLNLSPETKAWYQSSKQCVSKVANNNSESIVAENWADWLTARLQISSENLACGLIRSSKNQGRPELSVEAYSTHPTDFYRLIHGHYASGKELPQSCISALNDQGLSQPDFSCSRGLDH